MPQQKHQYSHLNKHFAHKLLILSKRNWQPTFSDCNLTSQLYRKCIFSKYQVSMFAYIQQIVNIQLLNFTSICYVITAKTYKTNKHTKYDWCIYYFLLLFFHWLYSKIIFLQKLPKSSTFSKSQTLHSHSKLVISCLIMQRGREDRGMANYNEGGKTQEWLTIRVGRTRFKLGQLDIEG